MKTIKKEKAISIITALFLTMAISNKTYATNEINNILQNDINNQVTNEITVNAVGTSTNSTFDPDDIKIEVDMNNKHEIKLIVKNERSDEYIDLHLEKFISKQNGKDTNREPEVIIGEDKSITYKKVEENLKVSYGDELEYTIRVYNEGTQAGFANEIEDIVPDGLEYIDDNETNKAFKWEKSGDKNYKTNILSKENGETNLIEGFDEEKGLSYKDVKTVFRVAEKEMKEQKTSNTAQVNKTQEKDGTVYQESGYFKRGNEGKEDMFVAYAKFDVDKKIKSISVYENGNLKDIKDIGGEDLAKVEISATKLGRTDVEIEYEITVTNNGTAKGLLKSIKDHIPEGMELVDSEDWTNDGDYIVNKELDVGESITKTIVLKTPASKLGTKTNVATVEADGEEKNIETEADAKVIVSISTGDKIAIGSVLTALVAGLMLIIRAKLINKRNNE